MKSLDEVFDRMRDELNFHWSKATTQFVDDFVKNYPDNFNSDVWYGRLSALKIIIPEMHEFLKKEMYEFIGDAKKCKK